MAASSDPTRINWEQKKTDWDLDPYFWQKEEGCSWLSRALQIIGVLGVTIAGTLVSGAAGTYAVSVAVGSAFVAAITLLAGIALGMKKEFLADPAYRQRKGQEMKQHLQSSTSGFNVVWPVYGSRCEKLEISHEMAGVIIEKELRDLDTGSYGEFCLANSMIWDSQFLTATHCQKLKSVFMTTMKLLGNQILTSHINELKHLNFTDDELQALGIPINGDAATYAQFRVKGGLDLLQQWPDFRWKAQVQRAATAWFVEQGKGMKLIAFWTKHGDEFSQVFLKTEKVVKEIDTGIVRAAIDAISAGEPFETILPYDMDLAGLNRELQDNWTEVLIKAFFCMPPSTWAAIKYRSARSAIGISMTEMLSELAKRENNVILEALKQWQQVSEAAFNEAIELAIASKIPDSGWANLTDRSLLAALTLIPDKQRRIYQLQLQIEAQDSVTDDPDRSAMELEAQYLVTAGALGVDLTDTCNTCCMRDVDYLRLGLGRPDFDYGKLANRNGRFLTDDQRTGLKPAFKKYVIKMKFLTYNSLKEQFPRELELFEFTAEEWEELLEHYLNPLKDYFGDWKKVKKNTLDSLTKFNQGNSEVVGLLTRQTQMRINSLNSRLSPV